MPCAFGKMLFVPTSVYCYNFILISRTRESCLMLWNYNAAAGGNSISVCLLKCFLLEVESRTQGSRPRTQKKIRAQDQLPTFRGQTFSRPRTGMLKAKDTTRKYSPRKKKVFAQKVAKFSWNFSQGKNVHDLGRFSTNQKIVLSSAENRVFSGTWRLRGQGLDLRGQGRPGGLHLWFLLYFFILLHCRTGYLFGISIC